MTKRVAAATLCCGLLAGCLGGGSPPTDDKGRSPTSSSAPAGQVEISGALFLDLHVDSPCAAADAPPEMTGVTLTFRDRDGAVLGQTVSGPIGHQPLEFGEGKDGWQFPGCRYISPYSATLAAADSYVVTFQDATPENDGGVGFTGISDLGEQTISHAELEANGFAWDFAVEPSYVVGH